MPSRMVKRAQQAAFVAVFLRSQQAIHQMSAATQSSKHRYIKEEQDSDRRTAKLAGGCGRQRKEGEGRRAD